MANIISEKIDDLYSDLDDFIESCIMSRVSRSKDQGLDKSHFTDSAFKDFDFFFLNGAAGTYESFLHWWNDYKASNTWIGITGSWRNINQKVVDDVSEIVRYIVNHGLGIITGGALGVDYIATELSLIDGNPKKQLRVILPVKKYDYLKRLIRVSGSEINRSQLEAISGQLTYINKNFSNVIFDESQFDSKSFLEFEDYRTACYSFRNKLIAYACDGLIPFWVNDSKGVKDTKNTVGIWQKPVLDIDDRLRYNIDSNSEKVIKDYSKLNIPNLSNKYPLE